MHYVYYKIFGRIAQPYSGAEGIKVSEGKIIRLQKALQYVDMSTCVLIEIETTE